MSNLTKVRQAMAFLEGKGFDLFPKLSIEANYGDVKLGCWRNELTDDQFRLVKRVFGPLVPEEGYDGKNLTGKVKFADELTITCRVYRVYSCTPIKPEELTEEKWDEIKEHARNGLIKLQDCQEVDGKD